MFIENVALNSKKPWELPVATCLTPNFIMPKKMDGCEYENCEIDNLSGDKSSCHTEVLVLKQSAVEAVTNAYGMIISNRTILKG